jgi:hypothetical protein
MKSRRGPSANGTNIICSYSLFLTLLRRLNAKLEAHGHPPMTSLVKDLSDGVRLIQLMVCVAPCLLHLS